MRAIDAVSMGLFPVKCHIPLYAFDQNRLQYNAATILKRFESMSFHNHIKIIAVLNVDLFIPAFTHVFGEAREGGKCALISMFRLTRNVDGAKAGMPRILERIAKAALHEATHLFDVVHCTDAHCLMHFSMNGAAGPMDCGRIVRLSEKRSPRLLSHLSKSS
jgi:predicted Zn-dependent protease